MNASGTVCEVCQIMHRGPLRTYDAKNLTITIGGVPVQPHGDDTVDALAWLFGANRKAREPEPPPDWLFRVWAMVDSPAGSGVNWPPEKKILPGRDVLPIWLDVISTSHEAAKATIARMFREAGHSRWLVTKIERRDHDTETAREIVREALERARLGT